MEYAAMFSLNTNIGVVHSKTLTGLAHTHTHDSVLTLIVLPTEAFAAEPEASQHLLLLLALAEGLAKPRYHAGQERALRSDLGGLQEDQLRLPLAHLPDRSKVS